MELLIKQLEVLQKFDINKIISDILQDSTFQKWILDLVRWEQLYNKGIRGDGLSLGDYAPLSLQLKKDRQLDHITLRETGEFYNTFAIKINASDFIIDADSTGKEDYQGRNLFDRYDTMNGDLLGLTEENMEILQEKLTPLIINKLWDLIQ